MLSYDVVVFMEACFKGPRAGTWRIPCCRAKFVLRTRDGGVSENRMLWASGGPPTSKARVNPLLDALVALALGLDDERPSSGVQAVQPYGAGRDPAAHPDDVQTFLDVRLINEVVVPAGRPGAGGIRLNSARFPIPGDNDHVATDTEPGLVRAADLTGLLLMSSSSAAHSCGAEPIASIPRTCRLGHWSQHLSGRCQACR